MQEAALENLAVQEAALEKPLGYGDYTADQQHQLPLTLHTLPCGPVHTTSSPPPLFSSPLYRLFVCCFTLTPFDCSKPRQEDQLCAACAAAVTSPPGGTLPALWLQHSQLLPRDAVQVPAAHAGTGRRKHHIQAGMHTSRAWQPSSCDPLVSRQWEGVVGAGPSSSASLARARSPQLLSTWTVGSGSRVLASVQWHEGYPS